MLKRINPNISSLEYKLRESDDVGEDELGSVDAVRAALPQEDARQRLQVHGALEGSNTHDICIRFLTQVPIQQRINTKQPCERDPAPYFSMIPKSQTRQFATTDRVLLVV